MTQDTTTGIAIPADVMEAARVHVEAMPGRSLFTHEIEDLVARAIMAERERCAKIAETFEKMNAWERGRREHGTPEFYTTNGASYAAMDIAAAIRTPTTGSADA